MRLILTKLLLYISCACLLFQVVPSSAIDDTNSHLYEFARFSVTHHDNLDDEVHTHSHKHSDDGEEHEHNHEHLKIVQNDFKILCYSHIIVEKVRIIEATNGFFEKNLISNPHPFGIFKPPKV